MALIFSVVPYLVSPVTCLGRTRQRKYTWKTQIKHGLIIHYLAGGHQCRQDNPAFAPSTSVLGVIAQMGSSPFKAHGRGVRVGGTDLEISSTSRETMNFPLWSASLYDPVVSSRIVYGKFLSLDLRDHRGQKRGPRLAGILQQIFGKRYLPLTFRRVLN